MFFLIGRLVYSGISFNISVLVDPRLRGARRIEEEAGVFDSEPVLRTALLREGKDGPCAGVNAELAPELLYLVLTTSEEPGVCTLRNELGEAS